MYMYRGVRLLAALEVDTSAVDDGVAPGERTRQRRLVTDIRRYPGCVAVGRNCRDVGMPSDEDDIVAVGKQGTRRVTPDKTTRAGDRDPGHSIATVVAGRRRGSARLPRS